MPQTTIACAHKATAAARALPIRESENVNLVHDRAEACPALGAADSTTVATSLTSLGLSACLTCPSGRSKSGEEVRVDDPGLRQKGTPVPHPGSRCDRGGGQVHGNGSRPLTGTRRCGPLGTPLIVSGLSAIASRWASGMGWAGG